MGEAYDIEDNRAYVTLKGNGPITAAFAAADRLGQFVAGVFAAFSLNRGYTFNCYKIIIGNETAQRIQIVAGESGTDPDRFILWDEEVPAGANLEIGGDARVPLFSWQPWQEGANLRGDEIGAARETGGSVTITIVGWVEP